LASDGLGKAIKAAGSISKLARALGISPQAVWQWREIPVRHVISIERIFGVPREELRLDLYRRG